MRTGELDYSNLAPDFPTGGTIINKNELSAIYSTGKGKAVVRAKTEIKGNTICVTELPYQVYVEPLLEEIKTLIEKEEITGIEEVYNKTDKSKLLVEIECSSSPLMVLNQLYKLTNLQKSYSANQMALVSKTPKLLNLKEYLDIYITHNIECLVKEFEFDKNKIQKRLEIVEGLLKALEDIDNVIAMIKASESAADAKTHLMSAYDLNEAQAKAIVDMKLGKLAHLEAIELKNEKAELTADLDHIMEFLAKPEYQNEEFLLRLNNFGKKYSTPRKTQVAQIEIPKEEKEAVYVEPEKCVVVMTEGGLIKRVPTTSFRQQKRGGKGIKTQDDITSAIIRTNTVDSLMIFSDKGIMYRLLVNDIPVGTNAAKGVSVKGLVPMDTDEKPNVIYSIYKDTTAKYVIFVTKNGLVKKTPLSEYTETKRKTGIAAIKLKEGDELVSVSLVDDEDLIVVSHDGMGIRFNSMEIGATSRNTSGIKGITLAAGDYVVAVAPVRDIMDEIAIFTEDGHGKKMALSELPLQKRAGKGLKCGKDIIIADIALVSNEDLLLLVGNNTSICVAANEVPSLGRPAVGNQIIKTQKLISVSKV